MYFGEIKSDFVKSEIDINKNITRYSVHLGLAYLKNHLHCEDYGKHVIKVVQNLVPESILIDWFLCGQRKTAGTDDNHNKQVKVAQVNHKMTKAADSEK